MKQWIRTLLASRNTMYFVPIATASLLILSGFLFLLVGIDWVSLCLASISIIGVCLSWLSFVFRTHSLIRTQRAAADPQVLSTQVDNMEKELRGMINEHAEQHLNEYKNQALNTLIKLEQLRVMFYTDPEGNYGK